MTFLIALDILGFIFGVLGAILVGRLDRRGFLAFIMGSLSHGTLGLLQGNVGLALTSAVFICIDIFYFRKWKGHSPISTKMVSTELASTHKKGGPL